jgi:hypothetical protein
MLSAQWPPEPARNRIRRAPGADCGCATIRAMSRATAPTAAQSALLQHGNHTADAVRLHVEAQWSTRLIGQDSATFANPTVQEVHQQQASSGKGQVAAFPKAPPRQLK